MKAIPDRNLGVISITKEIQELSCCLYQTNKQGIGQKIHEQRNFLSDATNFFYKALLRNFHASGLGSFPINQQSSKMLLLYAT